MEWTPLHISADHLLRVKRTIPDEEMRHPTALDRNNNACLMMIKRGNAAGLTVGRDNEIYSYARNYYDGKAETSKEWAILPLDLKSCAFSEKDDSGFLIVDGLGRIGGLLTGGAGTCLPRTWSLGHHLHRAHQLPPRAHAR